MLFVGNKFLMQSVSFTIFFTFVFLFSILIYSYITVCVFRARFFNIFLSFFIIISMKRKILKSTFILMFGGISTKILGMLIKIFMSRNLGIEGMRLYMLVLPTFSLFISIGQLSFPLALSRSVAMDDKNNKNLYFSCLLPLLLFNAFLSILIAVFAKGISTLFLHDLDAYLPILAISFVIPFTTVSNLLRSYFIGKERMGPHVFSNIVENVLRLFFMMKIIPMISYLSIPVLVFFIILSNIISEASSTIILFFFLPKRFSIRELSFQKEDFFQAFFFSIPNISSSLIGNIAYFLEPVILLSILLSQGYLREVIQEEYAVITGYVYPLLLLPSFFSSSLSQAIMPYLTREYRRNNKRGIFKFLGIVLFFFGVFGILVSFLFILFGKWALFFIYHTNLGYDYLRFLSFFTVFYYLQAPLNMVLISMGKTKDIFSITLFSAISRILSLVFFLSFHCGIWSLLYAFVFNVLSTSIYLFFKIYQSLQ